MAELPPTENLARMRAPSVARVSAATPQHTRQRVARVSAATPGDQPVGWVELLRNPSSCRRSEDGFRSAQPILLAAEMTRFSSWPGLSLTVCTHLPRHCRA